LAAGVSKAVVLAAIALAAASGCRAEKAAESPAPQAAEPSARLSELDALEHDLAIAEQRLSSLVQRKLAATDRIVSGADEMQDRAIQVPESDEEGGLDEQAATGWRRDELATPCDLACRALASMKRSADSICAISGESDARCVRARSRVTAAEGRVERAGCACRER
jgi:hypothetical protein